MTGDGQDDSAAPARLRAAIAGKRDEIARLEAEIAGHQRALGEDPEISPFAPAAFPDLPVVAGVRLASVSAGVRYTTGRLDVTLAQLDAGSVMAGTFTRSGTRAAPVLWCETQLPRQDPAAPMAVLVNAGNANAFTGGHGTASVERLSEACSAVLDIPAHNVFLASTGVIGEPLPDQRITDKLTGLAGALDPGGIAEAAEAIRTTDTYAKGAGRRIDLDGVPVAIAGIAKGSGMIAPDMATMLVFVFTDAAIDRDLLQATVADLTDTTFNAITVDSDTSTSDTLLVGATGQSGMAPITGPDDPRYGPFRAALGAVMRDLALLVVKDGEGISKFVTVTVGGAASDEAARRIGLAIANAPLVKTAIAGEDPNWGRIVMAVGKSGEAADRDRLSITLGDTLVAENGWVAPGYTEEAGAAHMRQREIGIGVDVGVGTGAATVWTCDLTHRYITINADYRS